jgi:hypothetical protein
VLLSTLLHGTVYVFAQFAERTGTETMGLLKKLPTEATIGAVIALPWFHYCHGNFVCWFPVNKTIYWLLFHDSLRKLLTFEDKMVAHPTEIPSFFV